MPCFLIIHQLVVGYDKFVALVLSVMCNRKNQGLRPRPVYGLIAPPRAVLAVKYPVYGVPECFVPTDFAETRYKS